MFSKLEKQFSSGFSSQFSKTHIRGVSNIMKTEAVFSKKEIKETLILIRIGLSIPLTYSREFSLVEISIKKLLLKLCEGVT